MPSLILHQPNSLPLLHTLNAPFVTMLQSEGEPMHVPMSPLGEDCCVGEANRMIQNSLEGSGRFRGFWRCLEGCYRKVPEEWVSGI